MENNLFDPTPNPSRSRIARRSDPATSHAAAAGIEPKLNDAQEKFIDAVRVLNCATASEAAAYVVATRGGLTETYRKRAGECLRLGGVVADGVRRCRVTGKQATVYRIPERMADPATRPAIGVI